jgi:hypothetical protein
VCLNPALSSLLLRRLANGGYIAATGSEYVKRALHKLAANEIQDNVNLTHDLLKSLSHGIDHLVSA